MYSGYLVGLHLPRVVQDGTECVQYFFCPLQSVVERAAVGIHQEIYRNGLFAEIVWGFCVLQFVWD